MEKMTRNEAASFLGVEPQTITNWVKKGLLGGYNDPVSRRFYVNADDVHKFSEKYKLMAVSENALDDAIKKLKEENETVNASLEKLMKSTIDLYSFKTDEVVSIIQHFIDKMVEPESYRKAYILRKFILGCRIHDIAEDFGLTESRVRTLLVVGLKTLVENIKSIKEVMEENALLKNVISQKKKEIEKVKDELILRLGQMQVGKGQNEEKESYVLPEIFKKRVVDLDLPVRVMNCLRYSDIVTIGDLVKWKKEDLLKIPNMGKKGIYYIEEVLAENGLSLDMPIASIYASGLKAMAEDIEFSDIMQQKIYEIALYCQKKYNLDAEEAMGKAISKVKNYISSSDENVSKRY